MKNLPKKLTIWALVVAGILTIPNLAQAPWTVGDYIFAGVVLFGSATAYELISLKLNNKTHRIVAGIGTLMFIFLVWAWAVAGP